MSGSLLAVLAFETWWWVRFQLDPEEIGRLAASGAGVVPVS